MAALGETAAGPQLGGDQVRSITVVGSYATFLFFVAGPWSVRAELPLARGTACGAGCVEELAVEGVGTGGRAAAVD